MTPTGVQLQEDLLVERCGITLLGINTFCSLNTAPTPRHYRWVKKPDCRRCSFNVGDAKLYPRMTWATVLTNPQGPSTGLEERGMLSGCTRLFYIQITRHIIDTALTFMTHYYGGIYPSAPLVHILKFIHIKLALEITSCIRSALHPER